MTGTLLKGAPVAREIRGQTLDEIAVLREKYGVRPRLAIIRIGDDPSSAAYARSMKRACEKVEVASELIERPDDISEDLACDLIKQLNDRQDVHGIILLQPLPGHIDTKQLTMQISPSKDVDGANPWNAGRLAAGDPTAFAPSTPAGGMELLKYYGVELQGKHAVVVGRSNVVGQPMAGLLLNNDATVTITHSKTRDLASFTRQADVLVTAVGRKKLISAEMVKPGVIVIDFGVNVIDGDLVGDVDTESVQKVASAITPVPGGTGSVTTAMVVRNTTRAACRIASGEVDRTGCQG